MISNSKDGLLEDESWDLDGLVANLNYFFLLVNHFYELLGLLQPFWRVHSGEVCHHFHQSFVLAVLGTESDEAEELRNEVGLLYFFGHFLPLFDLLFDLGVCQNEGLSAEDGVDSVLHIEVVPVANHLALAVDDSLELRVGGHVSIDASDYVGLEVSVAGQDGQSRQSVQDLLRTALHASNFLPQVFRPENSGRFVDLEVYPFGGQTLKAELEPVDHSEAHLFDGVGILEGTESLSGVEATLAHFVVVGSEEVLLDAVVDHLHEEGLDVLVFLLVEVLEVDGLYGDYLQRVAAGLVGVLRRLRLFLAVIGILPLPHYFSFFHFDIDSEYVAALLPVAPDHAVAAGDEPDFLGELSLYFLDDSAPGFVGVWLDMGEGCRLVKLHAMDLFVEEPKVVGGETALLTALHLHSVKLAPLRQEL